MKFDGYCGMARLLRADRADLLSQAYVGSRFSTVAGRLVKISEDRFIAAET